ncbi:MAG: SAM-dependent methyltransferase [Omnitrophica WOR_2 bacterium]
MRKNQASITAEGIALIRAHESAKPVEDRVCYDPLARQFISPIFYALGFLFIPYGRRRSPGVEEFLIARTRYIDDYLSDSLKEGIDQLVILGAGLDSRAYRFEGIRNKVKTFEVDHPASQQVKLRKLKRIFGDIPEYVVYVPIDFSVETLDKLFDYGYDENLTTLFIWEGVTYYITEKSVNDTFHFITCHSGEGSRLIFDYMYISALRAAHKRNEVSSMHRYSRMTGEDLIFGIEEGTIVDYLQKRSFDQIVSVDYQYFQKVYFSKGGMISPVAPIYAIVHARVKRV